MASRKYINIENIKGIKAGIDIDKAIRKSAKECKEKVKALSPKGARYNNSTLRGKSYAETWTYTMNSKTHTAVVYNESNYRLTHLLENGHFIVNKKGGIGWSAPKPHARPAFDAVSDTFVHDVSEADIEFNIYE